MKKLAVLSIVLMMLTALVFAEVKVEPAVAFSGSGTLTWGIDLDTTANNGFSNTYAANLTVTFVPSSTESKAGAEGDTVFGAISLTGMGVVLNSDNNYTIPLGLVSAADGVVTGVTDATTTVVPGSASSGVAFITPPTIDAWVMLGPAKWFITVANAGPDLLVDFATQLEDDANDAAAWWAEKDEADNVAPDYGAGATGFEMAFGPVTVDALVASAGDWTVAGSYGAALKAALVAGPATVKIGANYPFSTGPLGAGASLGLALGPATISAAFDMSTASGTPMEITGGVALALPDVATITANVAYSAGWGGLDAEVGATLVAVPNLTFSTLVGLWDITTDLAWGVHPNVAYQINLSDTKYVKPGVDAYISTGSETGDALRIAIIGTVTAVVIPNTTFVLTYSDYDLTGGSDRTLTAAATVAY